MSFWACQRRSSIGIDVTSRYLTAVQLERAGTGWRLASVARFERQHPELDVQSDEVSLFAEVLERQGFQGSEIVLAVPSGMLKSDLLELPAGRLGVSLGQLARMELARTHKCNPESFELTAWSLPASSRGGEGQQVLAAACMHDDSETILEAWERGGLEVVALDVRAAAVARICKASLAGSGHIGAALDINWESSHLVVTHQDTVIYERTLTESGLTHLHQALAKRLEIESDVAEFAMFEVGFTEELKPAWIDWPLLTDARGIMATHFTAMLDELQVSFSYARHRYPGATVDRLHLLGRGAAIPHLDEPITTMLGIETHVLAPGDVLECPPSLISAAGEADLTVAAGLAGFEG